MHALAAALVDVSWSEVAAIFVTLVAGRLYFEVGRARFFLWVSQHPEDAIDLVRDLGAGRPRARRYARRAMLLWPWKLTRARARPKHKRPPRRAAR